LALFDASQVIRSNFRAPVLAAEALIALTAAVHELAHW